MNILYLLILFSMDFSLRKLTPFATWVYLSTTNLHMIFIFYVCFRLSRTAEIIYSIHDKIKIEAARSLYFALTHPVISYLLLFWGSTFDFYLDKMQVLQNKIVHNVFSQRYNITQPPLIFSITLKSLKLKNSICLS